MAKKEEKMVTVHLIKDGYRYKDDVFVGVNGKTYLIQRGKDVKVPEAVAKVLADSQHQDEMTNQMMESLSGQYDEEATKLGVE